MANEFRLEFSLGIVNTMMLIGFTPLGFAGYRRSQRANASPMAV